MRTTNTHVFFWDGIYSNWHPAKFTLLSNQFANSEQCFMWFKARHFDDLDTAQKVLSTPNPKEVKKLGRLIKNFSEAGWDSGKEWYMYQACLAKFDQNPDLKAELISTGDRVLVEASPLDKIWGIGMDENAVGVEDPKNWQGQNLLGSALMRVRLNLINKIKLGYGGCTGE